MKRYNKRKFTLIELMFVVAILVILIGISWVAGTKVLRSQAKSKTKAEIKMIVSAIQQYKDRFGAMPEDSGTAADLDFAEYLSSVQPGAGWTGKRPMFIDYKKNNIAVDNDNYDHTDAGTAGPTKLFDPYENAYQYQYIDTGAKAGTFKVWSIGLDGTNDSGSGDDVSSDSF